MSYCVLLNVEGNVSKSLAKEAVNKFYKKVQYFISVDVTVVRAALCRFLS
jgi:hypothetical protein